METHVKDQLKKEPYLRFFFNPSGRKKNQWYSRLGLHVRVTFSVDCSSENDADFFYHIINAPTQTGAIIVTSWSKSHVS